MRVSQCRCLKCGITFATAQLKISHCTTCFADETYLKPVEPECQGASPAAADAPSQDRPTA